MSRIRVLASVSAVWIGATSLCATSAPAQVAVASPAPGQSVTAPVSDDDVLLEGFRQPPQEARPQVWWHLMNGNVTKEGMELDLAWLARMGIGGVHAFSGALFEPTVVPHPLPFMSEGWRDAFKYAVGRAHALGMEVTIAGSPGWSQTGGPWVMPRDAMKKFVWSETRIEGGRTVRATLAALPKTTGPLQAAPALKASKLKVVPIASGAGPVIAFPIPDERGALPQYTIGGMRLDTLADAPLDLTRETKIPLDPSGATPIQVDFARVATVRALTLAMNVPMPFDVSASRDGKTFTRVGSYEVPEGEAPAPQQTVAFEAVQARVMRVTLRRPAPPRGLPGVPVSTAAPPTSAIVRLLRFSELPRISRFEAKAGFEPTVAADTAPESTGIDPALVIDLTDKTSADGTLEWKAPPGVWKVVRFGWTLTGQANAPAEPEATGLEVDKLDRTAVKRYIDDYLDRYRQGVGVPLGPTGISGLLTDSWEAGVQNWTPALLSDFKRLRGYDPLPWLPALAGYVVKNAGASDAFLADYRQTLKDLVVANHYAVLREAAHARGMTYYTEVQGDLPRAISDGLTAKGQSDIPTAEYWYRAFTADPGQPPLVVDLKEASSAAHLYGRKLAAAESLTMAALSDPWSTAPNMLKPVADRIFALGINRILIHDSHHQPFIDKKPGLQLGIFGQWFNRNETWAEQARPWSDYLARTSFLLQQGQYVADIAYLYGEQQSLTDIFNHKFNEAVPKGYGFDYMDAATLRSKLEIRGGDITTPSGMHYRVLYLSPDATRLSLDYLRQLRDLVAAGATLVGTRPAGKLGLGGSDAEFAAIADALWPQSGSLDLRFGKGRVLRTADLGAALELLGMRPDVEIPAGADLMTLHRRTGDSDIFFVSNQAARPLDAPLRFRVTGRVPEWWSPETGKVQPLAYEDDGVRTAVSLNLEGEQAGFVVFRRAGRSPVQRPQPRATLATLALDGAWDVAFEPGRGAPPKARFEALHDWSKDAAQGIRYFSGAATYSRAIHVPRSMKAKGRILLDLGEVRELASVSVNGRPVATAWHAPYRVDITRNVHAGRNLLEIKVTNLWVNRLIGDRQPGATPIAYAPQSTYRASSKLLPSGLIGPVTIVQEQGDAFAF